MEGRAFVDLSLVERNSSCGSALVRSSAEGVIKPLVGEPIRCRLMAKAGDEHCATGRGKALDADKKKNPVTLKIAKSKKQYPIN